MKRTTKRYTVNTKKANEEGKKFEVFNNLRAARKFARAMMRDNNFVSLLNFKRIPLAI